MPLEFALRPRFRLDEGVAPPRRARRKLPRLVLPIVGYWIGLAALTHAVILAARGEAAAESESLALGQEQSAFVSSGEQTPEAEIPPNEFESAEPTPAPAPAPVEQSSVAPIEPPAEESIELRSEEPILRSRPEPIERPAPIEPRREAPVEPRAERPIVLRAPKPRELPEVWEALAPWPEEPVKERPHPEPSEPPRPAQPPARQPPVVASTLPSCESVVASSSQDIDFVGRDKTPDLPPEAFARVLNHGAYLAGCSVPERTSLQICVAVQEGQAKGVSVVAEPANLGVSGCVANAVARLSFPYSRRLDVARTRFNAGR